MGREKGRGEERKGGAIGEGRDSDGPGWIGSGVEWDGEWIEDGR